MSTLSNNLLEFILGLLGDEEEQRKYAMNKEQYLEDAGYSGCRDEVDDVMRMSGDMRSVGHAKSDVSPAARSVDHGGQADYQVVKHITERHEHHHEGDAQAVQHITNNYAGATTTHSIQHTHNGDKYDIWADDEAQVALNGGVNLGEDVEIEGDFEYKPEDSFNQASVGGDGVAVANGDADTEGSFNTNGSGVQINGEDAYIGGDVNNAPGANGSVVGGGHIGDSSSDDDLIVKDNVLQFGENNQAHSPGAIQDSEESATTGGEVETIDDSFVVEDSLNDNELEFELEL